jgi:hypothetical protein
MFQFQHKWSSFAGEKCSCPIILPDVAEKCNAMVVLFCPFSRKKPVAATTDTKKYEAA